MEWIKATLSWVWRALARWLAKGPPPPPQPPKIIPFDPMYIAAGPELLSNGSFELGNFGAGNEHSVIGSSVITNWTVAAVDAAARWIRTPHALSPASDGRHFIDLTGGPPGNAQKFATLRSPDNLFQAKVSFPYVRRYECAIDLGIGPNDGPGANFGPPVKVSVTLDQLSLSQLFAIDASTLPPSAGVKWQRFPFRFELSPGYAVPVGNYVITITGLAGQRFLGVDNVSVRALALQPHIIQNHPASVPTGPNLVKNGGFENGTLPGSAAILTPDDPQIIDDWQVTERSLQWIGAGHPLFTNASVGSRFVDLTGGLPPGPYQHATLLQSAPLGLQAGKSYEVAVDIGVGPNNGADDNFGPPVALSIWVIEPPGSVVKTFICNAVPPDGTGVTWEAHRFRFVVPHDYPLSPTNQTIKITGNIGNRFVGVDNLSLRLLT